MVLSVTGCCLLMNLGIVRYRDRYTPKQQRSSLRGLPTDLSFFPEELKIILQGTGAAHPKQQLRKYNLTDFLEVPDEDDILHDDANEEDVNVSKKAEIIRTEEDDDLEAVNQDPDADYDLDEDDYGITFRL